jgi:hypothetical protein
MSLDYVIVGSDTNPMYLEFWDVISKVWREKFNVIPVLGLICDEDSEIYEDKYGLVKKFKQVKGVDAALQSQIVRLYLPKFLDGKCLISDIDMIPLSPKYFHENLLKVNNENIVIYSSDNKGCQQSDMYPMCYISAHSNTFKNVLSLEIGWDEFVLSQNDRKQGWYTDQKFIFEKINQYNQEKNNCIFLNRGWLISGSAEKRIDRIKWDYDSEKVKEGYYIDCHSLRPYSRHKEEIDKLIKLL